LGADSWGNAWTNQPIAKLQAQQFCDRLEMYSGPMVKVFVGPEKVLFSIPKAILCHHSQYFERALNGPYTESQQQQVILDEDKVEAFQLITQWMYSGAYVLGWHLDLSGQVGALLDFMK
jgi:BTB/POZ domain